MDAKDRYCAAASSSPAAMRGSGVKSWSAFTRSRAAFQVPGQGVPSNRSTSAGSLALASASQAPSSFSLGPRLERLAPLRHLLANPEDGRSRFGVARGAPGREQAQEQAALRPGHRLGRLLLDVAGSLRNFGARRERGERFLEAPGDLARRRVPRPGEHRVGALARLLGDPQGRAAGERLVRPEPHREHRAERVGDGLERLDQQLDAGPLPGLGRHASLDSGGDRFEGREDHCVAPAFEVRRQPVVLVAEHGDAGDPPDDRVERRGAAEEPEGFAALPPAGRVDPLVERALPGAPLGHRGPDALGHLRLERRRVDPHGGPHGSGSSTTGPACYSPDGRKLAQGSGAATESVQDTRWRRALPEGQRTSRSRSSRCFTRA
ncbi:MAG: hypothetical protein QM765_28790 [Myxococcales bacterium]